MKRLTRITAIILTICLTLVSHPFLVAKAEEVDNDPWGMLNQGQLEIFLYKYTTSTTGYQLQYKINSGSYQNITVNTWYTVDASNTYIFRNRFQITETAIAGTFIVFIPIQTQQPITYDSITISHGSINITDILGYGTTGRFIWVAYNSNAFLSSSTNYITVEVDGLKNVSTGFRAPQNTSLLFQFNDNSMGTSEQIMMTELLLMYLKMKSIQDNGSAEVNIDLTGIETKLNQIITNQTSLQTLLNNIYTSSENNKTILQNIYNTLIEMSVQEQDKIDSVDNSNQNLSNSIDDIVNTEDSMSDLNNENISDFNSTYSADVNNSMIYFGQKIQRFYILQNLTHSFIRISDETYYLIALPIILFIFAKILGG